MYHFIVAAINLLRSHVLVGNLCLGQNLSADSRPTVGRQVFWGALHNYQITNVKGEEVKSWLFKEDPNGRLAVCMLQ